MRKLSGFIAIALLAAACGAKNSSGPENRPAQKPGPQKAVEEVIEIDPANDPTGMREIPAATVSVTILDDMRLEKMLRNPDLVVVNGQAGHLEYFHDQLELGYIYCHAISTNTEKAVKTLLEGKTFTLFSKEETQQENSIRVTMMLTRDAGLVCARPSGQIPNVAEINQTMANILVVKAAK